MKVQPLSSEVNRNRQTRRPRGHRATIVSRRFHRASDVVWAFPWHWNQSALGSRSPHPNGFSKAPLVFPRSRTPKQYMTYSPGNIGFVRLILFLSSFYAKVAIPTYVALHAVRFVWRRERESVQNVGRRHVCAQDDLSSWSDWLLAISASGVTPGTVNRPAPGMILSVQDFLQ